MAESSISIYRRTVLGATAGGIALALLGGVSVGERVSESDEWLEPGYDPQNTGANPAATGPSDDVTTIRTIDGISGTPSVAGGTLYVEGDERLIALEREDGTETWDFDTEGGSIVPTVSEELVFGVIGENGTLHGIDRSTGDEAWGVDLAGFDRHPITAVDGVLFVATGSTLLALDAASGDEEWMADLEATANTGPAVANDTAFVGTASGVVATDTSDGEEVWRAAFDRENGDGEDAEPDQDDVIGVTPPIRQPVVFDGQVYAGEFALYALDASTGERVWQYADDEIGTDPVVAGDLVYAAAGSAEDPTALLALSATDGSVEWRFEAPDTISTTPAVGAETVYAATDEGTLYALNAETGDTRWNYPVGEGPSSPVVVGETLYVASQEHGLQILGEREASDESGDDQPTDEDDTSDDPGDVEDEPADDGDDGFGPGFGLGSIIAGLGGAGSLFLLRRKRTATVTDDESE